MLSRLLDPCGIVRVQSWDILAHMPAAIDEVVGALWPRQLGTVASGQIDVLCVGPADWLAMGGGADGVELCGKLGAILADSPLRATDVSQSLTRMEFEGPDVREFLQKSCSLDVHPAIFPPGRCTRTRFAGLSMILRCHNRSKFEGIVSTSSREYLLAWVADAGA